MEQPVAAASIARRTISLVAEEVVHDHWKKATCVRASFRNVVFTAGILTLIAVGASGVILVLREAFPENVLVYMLAPLLTYVGVRAYVTFEKRKR